MNCRCRGEIIWICPEAIERGANCNKKYKAAKCKYNSINMMHSSRRDQKQCVHYGEGHLGRLRLGGWGGVDGGWGGKKWGWRRAEGEVG